VGTVVTEERLPDEAPEFGPRVRPDADPFPDCAARLAKTPVAASAPASAHRVIAATRLRPASRFLREYRVVTRSIVTAKLVKSRAISCEHAPGRIKNEFVAARALSIVRAIRRWVT
jgi:hypothetical protein